MGIDNVLPPILQDASPVFALSMDGGGIRSLLSIYALDFIEKELSLPISRIFDVIAATSASSLVAAGLTIPDDQTAERPMYEAEDMVQIITATLPEIFLPLHDVDPYVTRPRYDPQPLEEFLKVFYPGDFETSLTNLVLPTVDRLSRHLYSFKSWEDANGPLQYTQVLRASCASPNYFPAVNAKFNEKRHLLVDGGLHFYNPTGQAVIAALGLYPWKPQVHLSLGSGLVEELRSPFVQRTPISPVWGSPFLDAKIRFEAEGFHNQMEDFLGPNYHRAQTTLNLEEEALLGDFHSATQFIPSTMSVFEEVGKRYLEKNKEVLQQFCDLFRGTKRAEQNAHPVLHNMTDADYEYLRIGKTWPSPEELGIEPTDKEAVGDLKEYFLSFLDNRKKKKTKTRDAFQFLLAKERPFYKEMKNYMNILSSRVART